MQAHAGSLHLHPAHLLCLQVTLKEGQAIYLAANEPHAYLSGELLEVMATSDNVIRAGLTPKFKHTEVLCSSLTYETGGWVDASMEGMQCFTHGQTSARDS